MARARLGLSDLSVVVGSQDAIAADPFLVAASLADEYGRQGDVPQFRNLLLSALEHRPSFGAASEVIDALLREVGLFPYLDPDRLSLGDRFAYEVHRPESFPEEGVVFHGPQARVYWELMRGRSVILSAPTSFGKSLIIDAIVGSRKFKNILIVVPTIALIDETRRRLSSYATDYKVIAHPSQKPADKNIFVFTQERVLDLQSVEEIEFFVIDEFYKLSSGGSNSGRSALLNLVFHRLATAGKQFYLLGPDIAGISPEIEQRMPVTFVYEPFPTVASRIHKVRFTSGTEFDALRELCGQIEGETLIFCSSPGRATKIIDELMRDSDDGTDQLVEIATDWIRENFHPDWHFPRALKKRIGVHHGRIPRALAHFVVMLFNTSKLRQLVCTSTLIEGVNTKARNIVVFDNKIDKTPIDFFTFNNICGRSGRMFRHFIGHVYLFHPAPERKLPFVDVPSFSQSDDASASLLLQLEESELTERSRERVAAYTENAFLPVEVLRRHPDIDPERLIELAEEIDSQSARCSAMMCWKFDPTYEELSFVCDLIWRRLNGSRLGSRSAFTANQLAVKLLKLKSVPSTREQILAELDWDKGIGVDEAVRRVLDFNRLWASFHFPRLLMAVQSVAQHVLQARRLPFGDFSAFAVRVEGFFVSPLVSALDEYGIPIEITKKIASFVEGLDLDEALVKISELDLDAIEDLHPFERFMLRDAVSGYQPRLIDDGQGGVHA